MSSNSSKSNYLYDLPDENPNGVISFDSKLNLLYSNNSAKKKFLPDFDVNSKQIKDKLNTCVIVTQTELSFPLFSID